MTGEHNRAGANRHAVSVGPSSVGISLKNEHFQDILKTRPAVDFFEVHAENFMSDGGNHLYLLDDVRSHYPLSIHGVGMSLGSAEGLSRAHLKAFRRVVDRYQPSLVSEHLAWSSGSGKYLNDLLPVPLTEESLKVVAGNIACMQDMIGQKVLIENPSSYLSFELDSIPEHEFLNRLVSMTGCGLLLDINNVFVSASNMGWSAQDYLSSIDKSAVGELHLAGHAVKEIDGKTLRIDDHGSAVSEDVWQLYASFLEMCGQGPTLIEWDTNIPPMTSLLAEAEKVRSISAAVFSGAAEMAV